jgi:hypothetical protein
LTKKFSRRKKYYIKNKGNKFMNKREFDFNLLSNIEDNYSVFCQVPNSIKIEPVGISRKEIIDFMSSAIDGMTK